MSTPGSESAVCRARQAVVVLFPLCRQQSRSWREVWALVEGQEGRTADAARQAAGMGPASAALNARLAREWAPLLIDPGARLAAMDRMGLDATSLRVALISSTGRMTADVFQWKVLIGLLRTWWAGMVGLLR